MRYLDLRTGFLLLLSALFLVGIFFQHQTVLAGITQSKNQNSLYLTNKLSVLATVEEVQLMQNYYPTFQSLIESQRIVVSQDSDSLQESNSGSGMSSQRKISWIKLLESAGSQLDIKEMSFEIYPGKFVVGGQQRLPISVSAESIVLQVSLLHDGVLANLLSYLREYAPNPFVVSSLEIARSGEKEVRQSNEKAINQLAAEITLKWHLIEVNTGAS